MSFRAITANHFDAVIVGGNVGSLVAAAYLARSGVRVLVLEKSARFGGEAQTMELAEGIGAPLLSAAVFALDTEMVRTLRLSSHGLHFVQSPMNSIALRPAGKHIGLPQQGNSGHSDADSRSFAAYRKETLYLAGLMRPLWTMLIQGANGDGIVANISSLARHMRLTDRQASDIESLSRLSAVTYLDRWFDNDGLKAALSFDVCRSGLSPLEPGSALALLCRVALQEDIPPQIRGGPGALATALENAARAAGAQLCASAPIAAIDVEQRRATGVVLASGEKIGAGIVLSSLDRQQTILGLVPPGKIAFEVATGGAAFQNLGTAQIFFTLNGLPPFAGIEDERLKSRFIAAGWPETAAQVKNAALSERLPSELVFEAAIPTVADTTLAPFGYHLLSVLLPYMPLAIEGGWESKREMLKKQVVSALDTFAPGIRDRIVSHYVLTPLDLLDRGGAASGSDAAPIRHLLSSYHSRIRTPIDGLYMCGRTVEPMALVSGRAGRLAAELALSEWRGRKERAA